MYPSNYKSQCKSQQGAANFREVAVLMLRGTVNSPVASNIMITSSLEKGKNYETIKPETMMLQYCT
jgi:hypothetical protein